MSAPRMPRSMAQPIPVGLGARGRRRWLRLVGLCALLAVAALAWLLWRGSAAGTPQETEGTESVAPPSAAVLERGAYLVRVGACMGCHTAQGGVVLAGGGEVRTPFGVFHAPNLTPDAETGLGRWSLADFRRAMRHGVAPGGRLLYPAFPYEQYTALRTDDVDALYHYLRSLPPVAQPAQPHVLAFPYGSQWALALWRGLYFRPAAAVAQEGEAGPLEAGRYLVQAVAHCAACHSPRNGLGALGGGQRLEGGLMPTEGWQAPSLLNSREAGVQRWTPQAVVQLLRTGRTDAGATASGPMADAVFWSTRYLTDGDARAVAAYLQRLPDAAGAGGSGGVASVGGVTVQPPAAGGGQRYDSGAQANFRHYCADCHGAQGQGGGPGGAFPPLAGNRAVLRGDPGNMLRSILQGGYAPATAGNPAPHGMPPFMQTLGDAEIAALATYIRQSWGNQAATVATMEVFRARQGRP